MSLMRMGERKIGLFLAAIHWNFNPVHRDIISLLKKLRNAFKTKMNKYKRGYTDSKFYVFLGLTDDNYCRTRVARSDFNNMFKYKKRVRFLRMLCA